MPLEQIQQAHPGRRLPAQTRPGQHHNTNLAELFLWTEEQFLKNTEGSAIRRTGYENWLRNLAVGLGNAPSTIPVIEALKQRADHPSELVREHVTWALRRHGLTA